VAAAARGSGLAGGGGRRARRLPGRAMDGRSVVVAGGQWHSACAARVWGGGAREIWGYPTPLTVAALAWFNPLLFFTLNDVFLSAFL